MQIEEIYKEVIKNLKKGIHVYKTCKECKINSSTFYRKITKEQKRQIQEIRALRMNKVQRPGTKYINKKFNSDFCDFDFDFDFDY